MDRNIQKNGLVNLLALFLIGAASAMASRYTNTATGQVGTVFLGFGLLVAAVSYFQMRLEARERMERLEFDELTKEKNAATLFASQEAETFPARRSREQFERFFVPAFTVILFLLEGLAVWWFLTNAGKSGPPPAARATTAMALYGVFFITLFLLGKFSANIARLERQRLLRPGASHMLLAAFICLLTVVSEALLLFEVPKADLFVARGLCGVLGVIAVETLLNLLLEIYRPRMKGQAARLLYESRLVGLLGQPGGIISTAAHALDYQFGFKVSETWFYRFLERTIAWIVLLQLSALLVSTMVVIVEPQEEVLLERFGRPAGVLKPGFHLKWFWPIEKAHRFDVRQVQTLRVGAEGDHHDEHEENTILWVKPHSSGEEFNLLVASRTQSAPSTAGGEQAVPVNLLTVGVPVHFVVTNVEHWAYNHAEPAKLLEKLATREVVRHLVSVDADDIMAQGRLAASMELQQRIQSRANEAQLGVKVLFVGLEEIHPPTSVGAAYEGVMSAMQEKEAKVLSAQGDQAATVPVAESRAVQKVSEAESYRIRKVADAAATAARFTNQITAFAASPRVFAQRLYLDTLGRSVSSTRKYIIVPTNTHDVINLNLEDKVRVDLLDVPMPTPTQK